MLVSFSQVFAKLAFLNFAPLFGRRYSLANTDHCICVSHTGKENTVLRSGAPKDRVSVIPNAVDADVFTPDYARSIPPQDKRIVVAIGSRLVYRKGIDLVVAAVPMVSFFIICMPTNYFHLMCGTV